MKIEFLSEGPDLRPMGDGKWRVLAPFHFKVDDLVFVIPEGFISDLDSVPRVPILYMLAKNRAVKAAVIHDYLYRAQVGKVWADKAFFYAMEKEGLWLLTRLAIAGGPFVGGYFAYKSHKTDKDFM